MQPIISRLKLITWYDQGTFRLTVTSNKLLISKPTNIFDLSALSVDLDLTIYAISALNAEKQHNGDR